MCSAYFRPSASCSWRRWSGASNGWLIPSEPPRLTIARGGRPRSVKTRCTRWGCAYKELLASDRDYLMLQHQSYAACDDEVVCACVRRRYAELIELARELSGADAERLNEFFWHGMALNVAAALGVEDLSVRLPLDSS